MLGGSRELEALASEERRAIVRVSDRMLTRRFGPGVVAMGIASLALSVAIPTSASFARGSRLFTAALLVLVAVRFAIARRLPEPDAPERAFSFYRRARDANTVAILGVFGAQATYGILELGIGHPSFAILLTLNAIALGAAQTLAPIGRPIVVGQLLLLTPPTLGLLSLGGASALVDAFLMLVNLGYTLVIGRRLRAQHWEALLAAERLRRKTETLARVQSQTRGLVEKTPDAMGLLRGTRLLFVNEAWAKLSLVDRESLVDRDVSEVFVAEDREALSAYVTRTNSAEHAGGRLPLEVNVSLGDGQRATWEISLGESFELDDGVDVRPIVGRDVTERRRLQTRVALSEHLASLGTLAAGVAHEINNPLTYLLANIDEVKDALTDRGGGMSAEEAARLGGLLDEAREGAVRVRTIVRDLGHLSREARAEEARADVGAAIALAARMTQKQVEHRGTLVVELPPDLPMVAASATKVAQIVTNLLVNAAQALPDGGGGAKASVRVSARALADAVEITVSDTGTGIRPEVLAKIFDPFFTTKRLGEGTGIGLSIVHAAVRSFGGEVQVASTVGEGTTFRVTLPRASSPTPTAPAATPTTEPAPGADKARILVVDDEPSVARALARGLARSWSVDVEHDPRVAVDRIVEGAYAAIVCDVMMPALSGVDVLRLVEGRAPGRGARFVFVSGGVFDPSTEEALKELACPLLTKPVAREQLAAAVEARIRSNA